MLTVERGDYKLTVNESGEGKDYTAATVVAANAYGGGVLRSGGFVAEKL